MNSYKTLLMAACVSIAASSAAHAQDIAMGGSENYIVEAPAIVGAGGTASSANYSATISIEGPTVPLESNSANYQMLGAPALFGSWPSKDPVVFGSREGLGSKNGGQAVTLFGRHFMAVGAGTTTAILAGKPVLGVVATSDTTLTGFASAGVNAYQNPLGAGIVWMQNGTGQSKRGGAYAYTPALVLDSVALIDGTCALSIHASLGDFLLLYFGGTVPGFALPLFNLDGALELVTSQTPVIPITPLITGDHLQIPVAIPNMPALQGLILPLQGVAISSLATLSGSFTNVLPMLIQ